MICVFKEPYILYSVCGTRIDS